MKKCSPEGRDCIESKSAYTFNCSVSCEGIYADVQWVENIEDEELVETELERRLGGLKSSDLSRLVYNDLKREIGMMKGSISKRGDELDWQKYIKLVSEYKQFKKNKVQTFRFNAQAHVTSFGKLIPMLSDANQISGEELQPSILQLVQIYFETATFDDIERDKKIKTEAQLSLIGGTMGLLSGFSIISGVEIIFFLFRSIFSLISEPSIPLQAAQLLQDPTNQRQVSEPFDVNNGGDFMLRKTN